jgi:hypothetical protein
VKERASGKKRHATLYKNVLAAAHDLYLQGSEALVRGLALFDLEWGNIQAGHAWVAAQSVEVDEDIAWRSTNSASTLSLSNKLNNHS